VDERKSRYLGRKVGGQRQKGGFCIMRASHGLPLQAPQFPTLLQQIEAAIAELEGRVVPKLSWSCPTDASWVNPRQGIMCENADEVSPSPPPLSLSLSHSLSLFLPLPVSLSLPPSLPPPQLCPLVLCRTNGCPSQAAQKLRSCLWDHCSLNILSPAFPHAASCAQQQP
jgi:D123